MKFPTLTTLPRMKTTLSAKPNSLEQRSWSEMVFVLQRSFYTDDTDCFGVCSSNGEHSFSIISRERIWERHCYKEDLKRSVCLCKYLSVWNFIVLWFCRKTNDITQLYIWTSYAIVAFTKKRQKKSKEGSSFKLHYCTSPAALVLSYLTSNFFLSNFLEKSSNFRQLLKNFGATFKNFWSNLWLRLVPIHPRTQRLRSPWSAARQTCAVRNEDSRYEIGCLIQSSKFKQPSLIFVGKVRNHALRSAAFCSMILPAYIQCYAKHSSLPII